MLAERPIGRRRRFRMRLRALGAGVGAAATVLVGVTALVAGSGPAGAAPTSLFSSTTSGLQATAVPAGICFVTITADGGHGGAGNVGTTEGNVGDPGGVAATVRAH